jgi:hypothetical protein
MSKSVAVPKKQSLESFGLDEYGLPPVIHTEVLSHLTGVTSTRLHQLIKDNRITPDCHLAGDKWRTAVSFREIFAYYRRQADRAKPASDRQLDIQNTLEDLRTKRLKNAKMARELLPYKIMAQDVGEIIAGVKTRFINFPDKLSQRVFRAKDKVEVAEILDREIRDIWAAFEDPKFMENIAAKVHDDEFEQPSDTSHSSGDPDAGG